MLYRLFILVLFFFSGFDIQGQNQSDNWYFGNKAGLNFGTCNPTILTNSQMNTVEGVATISDPTGSLLFYTDGVTVWNKLHIVMTNGIGLMGHASSTQSAIVVPKPGSNTLYYIFTPAGEESDNGLRFSIVDISLNGGLGEVIEKNTLIGSNIKEKVTAVRHANGIDIWVISRLFNSNEYKSWLVSSAGISIPITSLSPYNPGSNYDKSRGYLKPSVDGSMLFCAFEMNDFSEMSRFNNQTGAVHTILKFSNIPRYISTSSQSGAYGVEFSPNGRYMYVSTSVLDRNVYLSQYDVSLYDSAVIANSAILIDSARSAINPGNITYAALQVAKNGKIYVAEYLSLYLGVINNPDLPGVLCNFQINGQHLGGRRSSLGLPTFIQSYFNPHFRIYNFTYSEDCTKKVSFTLSTTDTYDSLKWDFGDPGSGPLNSSVLPAIDHQYNSGGSKMVRLILYNTFGCRVITDTVTKMIPVGIGPPNLGQDVTVCVGEGVTLNATVNNASSYVWNTGAVLPQISVTNPGLYWCEVTIGACVVRDSITIANKPYPVVNLGNDQSICEGTTTILTAGNPGASYSWQDGASTGQYAVTNAGLYHVAVNLNGCISRDTVIVNTESKPFFTLGENLGICQGQPIILRPSLQAGWQLLWNDGTTTNTYSVSNPGTYSLSATNHCGTATDEVTITQGICKIYVPSAFTPNEDGINDRLKVLGTEIIDQFHFQIYNRYGQLVYESKDKNKGWDGLIKGIPADGGTYVYQLNYRESGTSKIEKLNGASVLIR